MNRILVIKSSFMQEKSLSNQLINKYLYRRKQSGYVDQIIEHDLGAMN